MMSSFDVRGFPAGRRGWIRSVEAAVSDGIRMTPSVVARARAVLQPNEQADESF
jgi:hypothetical protein